MVIKTDHDDHFFFQKFPSAFISLFQSAISFRKAGIAVQFPVEYLCHHGPKRQQGQSFYSNLMRINYATGFSSSVFYSWLVYKDWLDYKDYRNQLLQATVINFQKKGKTTAGIRGVRAPVSPPVSPHTLSSPLTILGPEGPPWGLLPGLAGHCKVPCAGAGGSSCSCKRVLMPYSHSQGHASAAGGHAMKITKDIQIEERDRQWEVRSHPSSTIRSPGLLASLSWPGIKKCHI